MKKNFLHVYYNSLKWPAISLNITNGMNSSNIFIYTTALFLSSYPPSWIPYYFIGRAIIEIVAAFIIAPYLNRDGIRASLLLQLSLCVIIPIFAIFMQFNWYILPLIFTYVLNVASIISRLITSNSVRCAFDILEFKQINPSLVTATLFGKIFIGIFNAWLIDKYGIGSLPYITSFLLLINCIDITQLKPLATIYHVPKHGLIPTRYSIFVHLLIFSLAISIAYTMVDYCFRAKLSVLFNSQQIGHFISLFSVACYLLATIVTLLFAKQLMKFGIAYLLVVLPIFWVITPFVVLVYPSFITITLMAAGDYVLFNFISIARSILLNVLPSEIRTLGQPTIQITAESLGIGIASLLLLIFSTYLQTFGVIIIIILLNLFLIYYSIRLKKDYVTTLTEEIYLRRFSIEEDSNLFYQGIIEDNIIELLSSDDPQSIRYAYTLLPAIKFSKFPMIILKNLAAEESDIRIEAIKAIILLKYLDALPLFIEMFAKEKDALAKWWILTALAEFKPVEYLIFAKSLLEDKVPEIRAGSIQIIFAAKNSQEIELAKLVMENMLTHEDAHVRRIAAKTLINIPLEYFENHIDKIISDNDHIVSTYVIEAINKQNKDKQYLDTIIKRLASGGIYYATLPIVIRNASVASQLIIKLVQENKNIHSFRNDILISILNQIPDQEIEKYLIDIFNMDILFLKQSLAAPIVNRAVNIRLSKEFQEKMLDQALKEATLIASLALNINKYALSQIKNEIMNRLELAYIRFFHWACAYYATPEIIGLLPNILSDNKVQKSKAVELFCALMPNRELVNTTLILLSENYRAVLKSTSSQISDPWLTQVINATYPYEVGTSMNNMQKVFILRQIKLFNRLPAETLIIIANEIETVPITANQIIFSENDNANGLYMIASGQINIIRHGTLLAELKNNDFFGELALLDNAPRAATAQSKSEGLLLFLDVETFERITNDLPQVLRSITHSVLKYLRSLILER